VTKGKVAAALATSVKWGNSWPDAQRLASKEVRVSWLWFWVIRGGGVNGLGQACGVEGRFAQSRFGEGGIG
jgi:hypothetical protein